MLQLTAAEIADITGGTLRGAGAGEATVTGSVETDSRLVGPGSLFIAMPGEATDGHRFIPTAIEAGAALVIAEHEVDDSVPHVVVASGLAALHALAAAVVTRVRDGGNLRVIGVTGSNGKTTTKAMLQAALERHGQTVSPVKSFNNEVGAPMTMLRIDEQTRFLVLELGASFEGDIASLAALAPPDIGVVLKVGLAHAGETGSIEATARAKTEMVQALTSSGIAVLNHDDDRVRAMSTATAASVTWFGSDAGTAAEPATVWASDAEATLDGTTAMIHYGDKSWRMTMQILGEHHVMNALAALAVVDALGLDVEMASRDIGALPKAERGRMELLQPGGVTVINDAYNASPDSVAAAVRSLAHMARTAGRRSVAVLGEMADLGSLAAEQHDRVGRQVVRLGIDKLVVIGAGAKAMHDAAELESSFGQDTTWVPNTAAADELLQRDLADGDVVLVKASNSIGLMPLAERIGVR